MLGARNIVSVCLAVGLLLAASLGSAPDTLEDDDVQLPSIDLSLTEAAPEVPVAQAPQLRSKRWHAQARSTGREHSAAIFHPPI
ncbi:MAG: hypothetical protein QM723_02515 [Myxococcaceae bacterium]